MANPGSIVTATLALCFSFGVSNASNTVDSVSSKNVRICASISEDQGSNAQDSTICFLKGQLNLAASDSFSPDAGVSANKAYLYPFGLSNSGNTSDSVVSSKIPVPIEPVPSESFSPDDSVSFRLKCKSAFWDDVDVVKRLLAKCSESLSIQDNVTFDQSVMAFSTIGDFVEITEGDLSLTGVYETGTDLGEALSIDDGIGYRYNYKPRLSDAFAPSDNVGIQTAYFNSGIFDSVPASDSVRAVLISRGILSDNQGSNLGIGFQYRKDTVTSILEYSGISDDASAELSDLVEYAVGSILTLSQSDSIGISDGVGATLRSYAVISDDIATGLKDAIAEASPINYGLSDSVALIDGVVYQKTAAVPGWVALSYPNLSESFVPAEAFSALLKNRAIIGESAAPSDQLVARVLLSHSISDSLSLSDLVVARSNVTNAVISEALSLSDTFAAIMRSKGLLSDSFHPSDSVERVFSQTSLGTPVIYTAAYRRYGFHARRSFEHSAPKRLYVSKVVAK
jgi:hypothetical protein